MEPFLLTQRLALQDCFKESHVHALESMQIDQPFFLIKKSSANELVTASLVDWDAFFMDVDKTDRMVGFLDPSGLENHPGWPLRNFLLMVQRKWKVVDLKVLCLRRTISSTPDVSQSFILKVSLPGPLPGILWMDLPTDHPPKSVGWERNASGKLGPRMADLGAMMDPQR